MTYVQYIWILLSILMAVTCFFCFLQPEWFVHSNHIHAFGIYAFCVKSQPPVLSTRTCGFYGGSYGFGNIPSTCWQAACLLYGGGSMFMCIGALCSLSTMCIRAGWDKTLVVITRYLHASSLILMTSGLFVYPLALDSAYFRSYCGYSADVYYPGTCTVGWTFVLAITGNALAIFCPILSYFIKDSLPDTTADIAKF